VTPLGGTALAKELAGIDPGALLDPAIVERLERALADGFPSPKRAGLVQDAIQLLPDERVHVVAHKLDVSERQLRNLFDRALGLSPKQYARIHRVRAVLRDAQPGGDLAQLAAQAGYYDQSHMTTEFRRLVGVPPAAFTTGRRPPPTPCRAAELLQRAS
jgi:AraC-like DNA-binding protein